MQLRFAKGEAVQPATVSNVRRHAPSGRNLPAAEALCTCRVPQVQLPAPGACYPRLRFCRGWLSVRALRSDRGSGDIGGGGIQSLRRSFRDRPLRRVFIFAKLEVRAADRLSGGLYRFNIFNIPLTLL